ncbi:S8 family serine peptidase [Fulvimonas sp. R45]|uniref:S8 family serine peptidase n=1 Tax=Fulvimonas sp. R45 TaxID=3045937 RepID=UPI00265F5B5F|nr:S8 family serine peptidase [Fulvimonas sp. R45]MDO1530586.1 S8 family serine peptidase [Fulvimonas sp. R45]
MNQIRFLRRRRLLPAALLLALSTAAVAATPATPATGRANLSALRSYDQYDRFIVTYRPGSSERGHPAAVLQHLGVAAARAFAGTPGVVAARQVPPGISYLRHLGNGAELVRTSRKLGAGDAATLMRQIAADPAVAHVEPDLLLHAVRDTRAPARTKAAPMDAATPDDPYYGEYQWDFFNAVSGVHLPETRTDFPGADGHGITVAVIDTGITAHEDLDTSLAADGYDFISDKMISGRASDGRVAGGWDTGDWTDQEPWQSACTDAAHPPEQSTWHGTNVAGVIGELTDNGLGMAGMAPAVHVLPVRALGHCGGYTSDIADAIEWASGGHVAGVPDNTHPAQVINLSLGGPGSCSGDDVTAKAIADAIGRGTTVVVAAGNDGADSANYTPASCPGVVTVAATGITGKRAFYSNYGATVTLGAPGGGIYQNDASSGQQAIPDGFIWAALNAGTTTPVAVQDGGSVYAGMAGTSQATPHVSATVAMMLSAAGDATPASRPTPAQIKALLASSARPFPVTPDRPIGAGMLDAHAAVAAALGVALPPTYTTLARGQLLSGQQGAAGQSIVYALDVPAGAANLSVRSLGGTGDVTLYVKAGDVPALDGSDADYTSARAGNAEAVLVPRPQAATYYIRLVAVKDFAGLSILGNYTGP